MDNRDRTSYKLAGAVRFLIILSLAGFAFNIFKMADWTGDDDALPGYKLLLLVFEDLDMFEGMVFAMIAIWLEAVAGVVTAIVAVGIAWKVEMINMDTVGKLCVGASILFQLSTGFFQSNSVTIKMGPGYYLIVYGMLAAAVCAFAADYMFDKENAAAGDPLYAMKKSDRALYYANAAIAAGVFAMLLPLIKTEYEYMSIEASVPGSALLMMVTVPDIFDIEGFFGMYAWLALAVAIGLAARFSAAKRHVNNRNVTVVLAVASIVLLWLYSHSAEEYYEEFGNDTGLAWGFWVATLLMAAGVGLTVYASTRGMDAPAYPVSGGAGSGYGGYDAGQYGAQNVYQGTQNAYQGARNTDPVSRTVAQEPRESASTVSAAPTGTGYVQVPPPVAPVNPVPKPESAGGDPAVKFCISCGAKIPAGAKFCSKCGSPQE